MTYKQFTRQQQQAAERAAMKGAIERLQAEDPRKYAELQKRAQDETYDRKVRIEKEAQEALEREERYRQEEYERNRTMMCPVLSSLPDIDMSGVRGMVAFRVWASDPRGLKSTAMGYHWKTLNFADNVPTRSNRYGLHCIKLTGLGVLTSGANYFDTGRRSVSGFIELFGTVEEHTDGVLRAEVAKLICLFVTSDNDEVGTIVKHLYRLYPTTPVFVLNPEQLAEVVMREVLRQKYLGRVS